MAVRRVERLSLSTEFRIDKDPDLDKKQPAIRINNHKPPLNHCVGCEVEVLEVVVQRRNRCGRAEKADCQFAPPIGQLHGSAKKETDRERERETNFATSNLTCSLYFGQHVLSWAVAGFSIVSPLAICFDFPFFGFI